MTSIYIYITNSINFVLILACLKALSKDLTRQANHQINVTINSTTAIVKKNSSKVKGSVIGHTVSNTLPNALTNWNLWGFLLKMNRAIHRWTILQITELLFSSVYCINCYLAIATNVKFTGYWLSRNPFSSLWKLQCVKQRGNCMLSFPT